MLAIVRYRRTAKIYLSEGISQNILPTPYLLIKRLEDYPEPFNAPIVMDFNPWRVVSEDQIYHDFFKALVSSLDSIDEPGVKPSFLDKLSPSRFKAALSTLDSAKLSDLLALYATIVL